MLGIKILKETENSYSVETGASICKKHRSDEQYVDQP